MKKRTLLWLVLALVVLGGGAWMAQETNLFGGITLSPRAKQLAYLKEHEEEIVKWMHSVYPKVESVQFDWNSLHVGPVSNGVSLNGYNLSVEGTFNEIPETVIWVDFLMPSEGDIPQMSQIRMNQRPGIIRGGTMYDYE